MSRVLLATCADLPTGDEDGTGLLAALERHGVDASWAVWTDERVDWDAAPVVIRSTWDYHDALPRFLNWVDGIRDVRNSARIVRWNTDKTYLRDLAAAGVPTVPSRFFAPGERVELPERGEFVVKPSVGAGSRGAGRFTDHDDAHAHAGALHDARRTVVVQPFLDGVDTAGETALLYFAGGFSHAIRKGPMLAAGHAHPVAGASLYIEENITARDPDDDQLAVGEAALAALGERFGVTPLYARVDLLPAADGPLVTELELVEPSLFLVHGDGAADRFAQVLAASLRAAAVSG